MADYFNISVITEKLIISISFKNEQIRWDILIALHYFK